MLCTTRTLPSTLFGRYHSHLVSQKFLFTDLLPSFSIDFSLTFLLIFDCHILPIFCRHCSNLNHGSQISRTHHLYSVNIKIAISAIIMTTINFISFIDEDIKNAIFGNVGTQCAFRVGVTDAGYLQHEFQPTFNEGDLINVERYHAYVKTLVNGDPTLPFSLDLTRDMVEDKKRANPRVAELIRELSRLKYGRARNLVDQEIAKRSRLFEVIDASSTEKIPSKDGGMGGNL